MKSERIVMFKRKPDKTEKVITGATLAMGDIIVGSLIEAKKVRFDSRGRKYTTCAFDVPFQEQPFFCAVRGDQSKARQGMILRLLVEWRPGPGQYPIMTALLPANNTDVRGTR